MTNEINVDTLSRFVMVLVLACIFIGLNWSVMAFIWHVFDTDLTLLKTSPTQPRIVTTQVLMSLIGATVVQVGVAIVAVVSYLFPKKPGNKP